MHIQHSIGAAQHLLRRSDASLFVKKTTTGYACGIKKAMPMSRNDKPPTIQ
jgi:hypothetical protein